MVVNDMITQRRLGLVMGALLVLGVLVFASQWMRDSNYLDSMDYVVDGVTLVTNNDGYYHLKMAEDLGRGELGWSSLWNAPGQSLLLAGLVSVLGGPDSLDIVRVGSWLGPIFGLTMLLGILPWCRETRSELIILAAPLLAYLAPYWISRTHFGVLDTDGLVPCIVYIALYCFMKFSTSPHRVLWLVGYLLPTAFLWLWWKPGTYICLGMLGLNLLYWPSRRNDLWIKLAIVVLGLLLVGLTIAGVEPFSRLADYFTNHVRLAFGAVSKSLISSAIIELEPFSLAEFGDQTLGSWWLSPLLLGGIVAYGLREGRKSVFLIAFALAAGGYLAVPSICHSVHSRSRIVYGRGRSLGGTFCG